MNYLFYAILAQAVWAISLIFDKIIISKYIKDPNVLVVFFGIINFLPFLIISPFIHIIIPELKTLLIALIAGAIMSIAMIPYTRSISIEEASRVAPLWHLSPVFVLVLASFFLGERLSLNSYIGFFFLLFGGLLISTKEIRSIFKISKVFWLMLTAGFLFAVSEIVVKFIYSKLDFWNGLFWIVCGFLIGSLALLIRKSIYVNFKRDLSSLRRNGILALSVSSLGGFIGRVFYFFAIMIGSVSLASVIGGFESLFVLVYAVLISKYLPKIFKEEVDKKIIIHKIIAIFLMFIGLAFIYL